MVELGELALWAALPLAVLAAAMSLGGGWTGRADLAAVGRRAVEAAAALQLLALIGLAYALASVELRYSFVAAVSGFSEPTRWRIAALWSAPPGGALALAFLISAGAAVSGRLGQSRQGAARTGALAALAVIGLLMVLARAQPFVQREAPALVGGTLPFVVRSLSWQLEAWATYLAIACGGVAFASVVGCQLCYLPRDDRLERGAMRLAATFLTLAILAASWRAYAGLGRMFDVTGLSAVATHVPAWLLAHSYLHAPAGPGAPRWGRRWGLVLSVAVFPATVADGAAILAAQGDVPPPLVWTAGLAVGVLAGAMAGMTRLNDQRVGELAAVQGFGPWAKAGAVAALAFAGLVAVWAMFGLPVSPQIIWPVALLSLAAAVSWAVVRPAGTWKRVWPLAALLAVAIAAGAYALSGGRGLAFAAACGLTVAALLGLTADVMRVWAARLAGTGEKSIALRAVVRRRVGRRWASAFGHLGLALIIVGLSAESLRVEDTQPLRPGEELALTTRLGAARVTFLGLSRYQIGQLEKRVASFKLHGGSDSRLVTSATITDLSSRRVYRVPALVRGPLRDVVVELVGRTGGENILCRVANRPLAGLVWLGGLLLLASAVGREGVRT